MNLLDDVLNGYNKMYGQPSEEFNKTRDLTEKQAGQTCRPSCATSFFHDFNYRVDAGKNIKARKKISKCLSENYKLLNKEDLGDIIKFLQGMYDEK